MIKRPDDLPEPCQPGEHEWTKDYYGMVCRICGEFMPDNYPLTEEEEREAERDEYWHNHGTCEICGGEWGDGWSNCTCDSEEG